LNVGGGIACWASQSGATMNAGTSRPLRFAAIGLDHRHIYEMTGRLLELGCECVGYWTEGEPQPLEGFVRRFPHIPRVAAKLRLRRQGRKPSPHMLMCCVVTILTSLTSGFAKARDKSGPDRDRGLCGHRV
jgi:hypothetical protein